MLFHIVPSIFIVLHLSLTLRELYNHVLLLLDYLAHGREEGRKGAYLKPSQISKMCSKTKRSIKTTKILKSDFCRCC